MVQPRCSKNGLLRRIPSNTMATDEADAKLQSFLQWLQANGADLRDCTIRACGDKGFGVFSTAPEPGATDGVVMVVPLDLAITPMRVLQDPLVGPRCRALFEDGGVDDRLLVMLFLMAERLRPGSLWKPYLDMLPSTFVSSIWFTEEELAELEGTTLYRATMMQRKSVQTLFTDKVKGLVEELLHVDESASSMEVSFEDFLWANSIFWTRALNIPLPHSYVFPRSCDDQLTKTDDDCRSSSLPINQSTWAESVKRDLKDWNIAEEPAMDRREWKQAIHETDITAKKSSVDGNSEPSTMDSIWVEGLVPGIDFCNHNVKALATWEVDSEGNATGVPASMYLMLADKSSVEAGAEIYINYGNKGNEELLYLYGFVLDNNPDDYLMVHYPVEALRQVQSSDVKMKLLEIQAGSSQDREPSDAEVKSAIWEVCGDHGSLGLLVDLLRMAELEESTGTEASDSQLLETFYSNDLEDSARSDENKKNKSKINRRSCIVYRRGQKQLTRLFLREAEHLLELSTSEQT
ncbi:hypothetical protein EJB05_56624 [Eragrostis curvula]|uniref:Uncharacterized protein n=1 Tax=Eragrostis curvula TaxID=38414 RepID=A0A5J9SGR5_9POAL|nr:hypothetical protein EJB05_56624 [Eragrostis curvula]